MLVRRYKINNIAHNPYRDQIQELLEVHRNHKVNILDLPKETTKYLAYIVVIVDANTLIGMLRIFRINKHFTRYKSDTNTYYINMVHVRERYRGRGYGKQLFQYVIDKFPKSNLILEVETSNTSAIGLYTSMDFKVVQTKDDEYLMKRIKN